MPSVYRNIVANYVGNIVTAILSFLFVPVYVRYLGVSTYGIIGFFATVQVLFSFLDMGIGMAINREMARHYYDVGKATYLRNLSQTLQVVYWSIGFIIGAVLLSGSSFLSANWFRETQLPRQDILNAFLILSLTIAFRWPYSLYSSGLRGMQRQVVLNIHDLCWNLTRTIGSWLVLKYISNTLPAFLWFQFGVTFFQTLGGLVMLWYFMPKSTGPRLLFFDKGVLKNIGRYAAGMGIAAILAQLVAQMDKLIVSKMVSDTEFGYYVIATNVAILVNNVSFPMYMAILPHFTKLFFENRLEEIKREYHFYTRLLSCLLLPFSVVVFFYSKEFLWLWTKNAELSEAVSPLLKLMIAGTTLNALVTPIQTLLLANNRVRFILYSNIIAFAVGIPVIILLTLEFGVRGGATSVMILFGGYFLIQAPLIFRALRLHAALVQWYIKDIAFFLAPLLLLSLILTRWDKYIISADRWRLFLNLAAIIFFYYVVTLLLNKQLRVFLQKKIRLLTRQQPV